MSNNDNDQAHGGNVKKNPNDKIVVADEDKKPHLENMANVQGSNKDRNDNASRDRK
jgi:hypothetical protein